MTRDFELIKHLNSLIEASLNERPKYREWFNNVKNEVNKAGENSTNRCVIASQLMLNNVTDLAVCMRGLAVALKDKH